MELGTHFSNAAKLYCGTACFQAICSSKGKEEGCKKNANSGQQKRFAITHSSYRNFGTKVSRYHSSPFSLSESVSQQYSYRTSKAGGVEHRRPVHQAAALSVGAPPSVEDPPPRHPHPALTNSLGGTTPKKGNCHFGVQRRRCCAGLLDQHAALRQCCVCPMSRAVTRLSLSPLSPPPGKGKTTCLVLFFRVLLLTLRFTYSCLIPFSPQKLYWPSFPLLFSMEESRLSPRVAANDRSPDVLVPEPPGCHIQMDRLRFTSR